MPELKIPVGRERLYKVTGLTLIGLVTLFVIFNGASVNNNSSVSLPSSTSSKSSSSGYKFEEVKYPKYKGPKEKATFVTLARNSDLYSLLPSIKSVEDRFNHKFQYDWVFLNDQEFTDEFKRVTSAIVSGTTKYGLIPKEQWSFPKDIDLDRAAKTRKEMAENNVIYGDSIPYRFMCRYESGFFYKHPLLDDYDWYWRVEPDIKLYCDIDYDVFKFMKDNGKKYGFSISIKEYFATIPTLWDATREFVTAHPEYLASNNMLDFVSDDGGYSYNLCHFWSNFEIASLNFWRGPAYSAYFEHLDKLGGFFYERWGDAPVHSIAAALFLNRDEVHHFDAVGYFHPPFHSCPVDDDVRLSHKCECNPNMDFTWKGYSCTTKFYTVNGLTKPKNWQAHAD